MIKGYSMDEMLYIKDNTPGIPYLCVLLIILLFIYIVYQLTQMYVDNQNKIKLEDYRSRLTKYKNGSPYGDDTNWQKKVKYSANTDSKSERKRIKKLNNNKLTGTSENDEISSSIERELKDQNLL